MKARFEPQKDITAYELAVIYSSIVIGPGDQPLYKRDVIFTDHEWSGLPETIRRHLKVSEQKVAA